MGEVPAAWRMPVRRPGGPECRGGRPGRAHAGGGASRRASEAPVPAVDWPGSRPRRSSSLVAWGFLVWAAIDFGRTARGGDGQAWLFLAIASLGAVACLFLSLMLARCCCASWASWRRRSRTSTEPWRSGGRRDPRIGRSGPRGQPECMSRRAQPGADLRPEAAGAEPPAPPLFFPGPPAGVEAADEVLVWLAGGDHQALAGGEHPGVEGVEPLDLRHHRPHVAVVGEVGGDAPRACPRCRRSRPGWVRACRPHRWRRSRPRPGCRSRTPAPGRTGTPRRGRGGSADRPGAAQSQGRNAGAIVRVLIVTSRGRGGLVFSGVEATTDSRRPGRLLIRSDVRSNTCTKLEHLFERIKHHANICSNGVSRVRLGLSTAG